jgi:hypothetical protein
MYIKNNHDRLDNGANCHTEYPSFSQEEMKVEMNTGQAHKKATASAIQRWRP